MLTLVISDNKTYRTSALAEVVSSFPESEVIVFDDTYGALPDLEQYLFPSLFVPAAPIVHVKYMLADTNDEDFASFLKKLAASPTLFLFEEMSLPKGTIADFKKVGTVLHEEGRAIEKKDNMFMTVASILSVPDKKGRWMKYHEALQQYPIEAMMGILYWKLRDLTIKADNRSSGAYKALYESFLQAHARAWQNGTPLEIALEKVILESQK